MSARKIQESSGASELEIIFRESLRILRSRSWQGLDASLRFSVQTLLGQGAGVEVWIAESLLRPEKHPVTDALNHPAAGYARADEAATTTRMTDTPTFADELAAKSGLHIRVQKHIGQEPHLWIRVTGIEKGQGLPPSFAKVWTALTPSILSACELVQFIAGEKEKVRLETELKTAELVQRTLIPASDIELPGVRIAASYRSALECGGDWWGVYRLTDTRSLVLIGDVTGHGTASALVSAMVKGYSDAASRRSNFQLLTFFEELNEDLYLQGHGETGLSFMGLVIDAVSGQIELLNAGHPAALKLTTADRELSAIQGEIGPVLGFAEKLPERLVSQSLRYVTGTHLVLYTDGLTECVNQEGRMLGEGRLLRALRQLPTDGLLSGDLIRAKLLQTQADWLYGGRPDDDTTLLVLSF